MAENWYQALGRGLIDLGREAPKAYQDYQDSRWKEIDRGNQLEEMIAKRAAYQQEEARKAWDFKQKQEQEKKVQDAIKALGKNKEKFESQQAEYERKQARIEGDQELLSSPIIQQGAQALAKQEVQGQQIQVPQFQPQQSSIKQNNQQQIEGQLPEQNVTSMDPYSDANRFMNDRSQQIDREFNPERYTTPEQQRKLYQDIENLNQALPELTGGLDEFNPEPVFQPNTEEDYLNAYQNSNFNHGFLNMADRVQGGRYDQTNKGGLTFEQKMQLEQAKEDLRNNRPLTEWQKALLQNMNKGYELKKEGLGLQKDGLKIRKENLLLSKEDQKRQDASQLTNFAKNTKDQAEVLYAYQNLDKMIPGGIYGNGDIAGFGFGTKLFRKFWKTEEANKIRPGIQSLINKVLKQRSGAAVSDQELNRLETEFGINTTGTIEEFRQGLQNFYESTKNDYDRFATADKQSAAAIDRQGYGQLQNTPSRLQEQRGTHTAQPPPQIQATWTNSQEQILQQKKSQLARLRSGKK
jgi:hypothetical protein